MLAKKRVPKAKKKPGRRPERIEVYMRKEVQKRLERNRKRAGTRRKPLSRSAYISALVMADNPETLPS